VADEQVASLYATLEVIAETKSVEDMDSALESLDQQLGGVVKSIEANKQALADYEEWTKALAASLDALGISAEEWASQLQRNEAEMQAARAEQEKLGESMAKDAEEAEKAGGAFDKLGGVVNALTRGSFKDLAGALIELPAWLGAVFKAVMFVAGAIVDLAAKAEHLSNKALSTGMTTDAVQSMQRLADITGTSSQSMFMAITRLQNAAEKNSKAFQKLRIDGEAFKNMAGDQQLELVAKKMAELGTQTERTAMATQLLGRGAAMQLMPALKELAENGLPAVHGMTEEQVKIMSEFDDSLDKVKGALSDLTQQMWLVVAVPLANFFKDAIDGASELTNLLLEDGGIMKVLEAMGHMLAGESTASAVKSASGKQRMAPGAGVRAPDTRSPSELLAAGSFDNSGGSGMGPLALDPKARAKEVNDELKKQEDLLKRLEPINARLHALAIQRKTEEQALNYTVQLTYATTLKEMEAEAKAAVEYAKIVEHAEQRVGSEEKIAAALEKSVLGLAANGTSAEELRARLEGAGLSSGQIEQIMAKVVIQIEKSKAAAGGFDGILNKIKANFANIVTGASQFAAMAFGADVGAVVQATGDAYGRYGDEMDRVNKMPTATKAEQAAKSQAKLTAGVNMGAAAASALGGVLAKSTNPTVAKLGGALQGAAAGAKMGAAFGPYGAAIGAVAGAVVGFINKAKQMKKEMDDMKKKFIESHGGLEKLKKEAEAAGVSLDKAFKSKSPAEMKKAIEEAEKKLTAFNNLLSKHGTTLEGLKAQASRAGVSLQAIWDAKTVEEYTKAVDDVTKKLDTFDEAIKKGEEIMERWGLTTEQMGPKFAQLKLDDMAAEMVEAFNYVTASGGDVLALLEKMGPVIDKNGKLAEEEGKKKIGAANEYLAIAIKSGAEIPEAMRPILEALFKEGKLLHENGDAYTQAEYDALKFGKTQAEMFDNLIKKITELVNALLGIPTDINTNVNINRTETGGDSGGGGKRNDDGDVPMADGGIVTRPTRILAGEAGAEAVIPLKDGGIQVSGGGGGAAGQPVQVTVYLGNEKMYEGITRASKTGQIRIHPGAVKSF